MKKAIRFLAIISILFLQCVFLSGCNMIDDLRDHQAYYTGSKNINYHDNIYILLPESEELQPIYDHYNADPINVTDSDVPVLLSKILSHWKMYESIDDRFLVSYDGDVYCKQELYFDMSKRIKEDFKATKACYFYDTYNSKTNGYSYDYYVLTDEQLDAVKEIMKIVDPTELPKSTYIDYTHIAHVEFSSDDLLFRKYLLDIIMTESDYYIRRYSDNDTTRLYTVPDDYKDIIVEIMTNCIDADNSYYPEYNVVEAL